MSATTSTPLPALPRAARVGRVTQVRVIRSEWTKLRSLRSTRWALLVTLLLIIGIGILACTVFETRWPNLSPEDKFRFLLHRLRINLAGVGIAQLSIGVLGVLVISGEYSTGMIRSTFSAVPKRLPVLWAKIAVFAAVTFAVTLPAVLVVFFAGQAILSGRHLQISFSSPGVPRAVIGAALFLTVMGIFGLGLGAIIRHTAGAIVTLVGIMFVLPPVLSLLPTSWSDAINPYLPSSAGDVLWTTTPEAHTLAPWTGFALFCGYAAASVAIAAVLMRRRDT
jgi:ABC-2 type transport system permease protein